VRPFFVQNDLAGALVAASAIAAVLVEPALTLRERAWASRTPGGGCCSQRERRSEDRNTKWVLIGIAVAGPALAVEAVRHAPSLAFPVTGWAPTIIGVAAAR